MPSYEELTAEALARAIAAAPPPFVLDVRAPQQFDTGHVPGSRNIPVHELVRRRGELPASKAGRVVLVGEEGKRTEAAAVFMALAGYADIAVLAGGFGAWTGPTETGAVPARPAGPQLRII